MNLDYMSLTSLNKNVELSLNSYKNHSFLISDDVGVTIKTDESQYLEWMKFYFDDYFAYSEGQSHLFSTKIYVTADQDIRKAIEQLVPLSVNELKNEETIVYELGDEVVLICQKSEEQHSYIYHYFYDKRERKIVMIVPSEFPDAKYLPMRIVRSVLILLMAEQGWCFFHSACVVGKGVGIGIIGDKFAGKSTTMFNLIAGNGYDFVSNDKIAIQFQNGRVIGKGFPVAAGLRLGTIMAFENLREWIQGNHDLHYYIKPEVQYTINNELELLGDVRQETRKVLLLPSEISKRFNVNIQNIADIQVFLIPHYDASRSKAHLERIEGNQVQEILKKQFLEVFSRQQEFLELNFGIYRAKMQERFDEMLQMLPELAEFYLLYQNETTNDQSLQLVRELIERKALTYTRK